MKQKKHKKSSKLQQLGSAVRQLAQPREFRIQPVPYSREMLELIERLALSMGTTAAVAGPAIEDTLAYQELMSFMINLLSQLGTGLWRLKQKMVKPGTDEPLDEMRRAFRHLESTWDTLVQAGVEIQDHTGQAVPEGGVYALKAIAYEATPGLDREQVIETVKPSIYFRSQRIQMGEVIVGTPAPGV
jgi:hypothetical protein